MFGQNRKGVQAVSPNSRKGTGFLSVSDTVGFAAKADYGPWRSKTALTESVGPIILRLIGDFDDIVPAHPLSPVIRLPGPLVRASSF